MKTWAELTIFLGTVAAVATGLCFLTGTVDDFRLNRENRQVTATVVSTDCANHRVVYYKFEVAGRTHTGSRAGDCSLPPGAPVPVYYLPSDPDINRLGSDPRWRLWDNLIPIVMFAVVVASIVYLQVFALTRRKWRAS